jgi:hypothetical protein
VSDQLPQCSYTDLRRCMKFPVDPDASVPLCPKHLAGVIADLQARGARIEVPQPV